MVAGLPRLEQKFFQAKWRFNCNRMGGLNVEYFKPIEILQRDEF
jgi:hypothetical protein